MADKTWKATERAIARRLGGQRVGNRGRNTEDVSHDWLSVEVKTRAALPGWLGDAMRQAIVNAPVGKLPVVVLHQVGSRHDDDLAVLALGEFCEWFGALGEIAQIGELEGQESPGNASGPQGLLRNAKVLGDSA